MYRGSVRLLSTGLCNCCSRVHGTFSQSQMCGNGNFSQSQLSLQGTFRQSQLFVYGALNQSQRFVWYFRPIWKLGGRQGALWAGWRLGERQVAPPPPSGPVTRLSAVFVERLREGENAGEREVELEGEIGEMVMVEKRDTERG